MCYNSIHSTFSSVSYAAHFCRPSYFSYQLSTTTTITTTPTTTCLFQLLRHHYYYATHSLKEDINRITLHHESVQLPSSKLPHTTITIVPLNVLCPVFIPTAANVYILPSSKKIEIKCYSGSVLSMMFYFPAATTTNHHYCTTITNQQPATTTSTSLLPLPSTTFVSSVPHAFMGVLCF